MGLLLKNFRFIEMANLYIHSLTDERSGIRKRLQDLIKTFNSDGRATASCDLQMILLTWLKEKKKGKCKRSLLSLGGRLKGKNKGYQLQLLKSAEFKDLSEANEDCHRKTREDLQKSW